MNLKYKIISHTYIFLSVLMIFHQISASENRLRAMGEMTFSVPDINAQVNLYQVAGNTAFLKVNDSANWMYYTADSRNSWGNLKRTWDAYKNQFHYISFSGQKHLGDDKIFYGAIRYNWDFRGGVDYAIEKIPYGFDPFVLTDYTKGDIMYHGPELFVAFNHLLSPSLYWGASVQYNINRGLKEVSSEAEIINRTINASLDLIFKLNTSMYLGFSILPCQTQDITKLVTQKDGLEPTVRRFRGEFEYRERTGTSDRTADYDGYEIRPQFSYQSDNIEHVDYISYFYQWHRIYDGTSTRHFDGYFQAQHFGFNSITRFKLIPEYQSYLLLGYGYKQFYDWAKEPQLNLLFFRMFNHEHRLLIGGSSRITTIPLLIAFELITDYKIPHQIDYLAQKNREGNITNIELKTGIEYDYSNRLTMRAGFNYISYSEDKIWNYYSDFYGYRLTFGLGWLFNRYELDFAGSFAFKENKSENIDVNDRTGINLSIQLKQYF